MLNPKTAQRSQGPVNLPSGTKPAEADSLNTKDMRRILGSSLIGSIIEYYDFILYATAASLVFDRVFFANLGPGLSLFASFATLAAGYVARPLGGIIFGHFGDRLGRKQMLVLSMLMMGGATVLIGFLPTTDQIGVAAPIVLVLLRIIQGIAVGGEWGGATLMALEHAPAKKRGFAAAFANAGGPAGGLAETPSGNPWHSTATGPWKPARRSTLTKTGVRAPGPRLSLSGSQVRTKSGVAASASST